MTEPPEELGQNELLCYLGWMSPLKYFKKFVYTHSNESHFNVGEELGN